MHRAIKGIIHVDITHVETVFKDGVGYDPDKMRTSVKGVVGVR